MQKIRLARYGRKNIPHFRIVVANDKSPRDGKFIKLLGYFNAKSKELKIDLTSLEYYISCGAQPTNKMNYLYSQYKKLNANSDQVVFLKS